MKKICVCIILLVMLLSISGTVFGESFSGNIVENIPETTIYDLTTKTKITGLVCIEPSQMLYTDKGYSYDDLKSLPEEKITSETDEDLDEFVSDGEKTFGANTYFYAKEDMTKDYEKDYKLWFIASFAKDIKDKQMAIWNYVAGPTFPTTSWYEKDWKAKGDELHEAAKAADEFLSTLIYNEDKDGNTISEKKEDGYGFTIKENNFEKVNVRTLTETEDIIVGPYQVEFDTGRFAGNIIEDEAGNIIEDEEEKAKGSRYIDIKFSYVDKAYIIDEKGEKIKDVEIVNVDGSKAEVSSAKPFYIKYNPYKDDGKTLMPSVRLCLDFKYLSGFTDKVYDKYKGCNYSIYYSKKYLGEGLGYEYTKHEFPSEGFSDNGQALADIKAQASWNNETHIFDVRDNEEFDLSLKKFITKVEYKTSGEKTIDDRVTVENTEGLYNKITHNAIYNKIYDPYKITKDVKSITYTIRIFNEGDVDGKAIKVEDYLPEGLEFDEGSSVVESAGYKVTYDKNSRKITFIDEGEVSNIAAFDGKNLSYTDIKIKCTVNDDVYEEVKYGEKKYDVSIEQYIGSKGNRTKEVEEGEEVKYTIEVTNKGDTKVYLKEIKQSLPKGIEFADNVDEWIVINNSDGSTEVSKIICEDIEGKSSKTYELKCKVTAKAGVLKTVSEIVSIAEPDINKSDWKDYAKVTVKNTVDSHVDLKLEQEIVSVNGKEVTGDEKKNKEVSKGDVIKYKITVTNEGTTSASNIRIADYIPDGMEFIPPSTDSEYEELKSIADDEFIEEKVGTTNAKWKYGENKNTVEYKSGLNSGDSVELYCVVTTDSNKDLKNIAEIISFEGGKDTDSEADNIKLDEYLYEKQEDDDDFTIVTTNPDNKKSDLKIEINDKITEDNIVTYKLKVVNKGDSKAEVIIKDVLQGMTYIGAGEGITYDKANKTIIINKTVEAKESVVIDIKCEITEEKSVIYLVNENDSVTEDEKNQYKKQIKHTAYIVSTDVYDKTKADWKVEDIIIEELLPIEKAFVEEADSKTTEYMKYLTNKAMIIKTSEIDRDESDWKDSETICVKPEEGDKEDPIDIKVVKKWVGDTTEVRPKEITINLLKNGSYCTHVTLNKKDYTGDTWEYTFKGLPAGYTYTVEEIGVEGYVSSISGGGTRFTITNKPKGDDKEDPIDIKVVKKWVGDTAEVRPKEITINLLKNGSYCTHVTLNKKDYTGDTWEYTFKGLPAGYTYTVEEVEVDDYDSTGPVKDGNTFTITNKLKGDEEKTPIDIIVVKKWVDENNKYDQRPESIEVILKREDGEKIPEDIETKAKLTGDDWTHTFKGLPAGEYTVEEISVPNGYKVLDTEIDGNIITITNEYAPKIEQKTTMEIAGNVFEDLPSTKGGATDNFLGAEDLEMSGIEVALYEEDRVTLAKLYQEYEEDPKIDKENAEIRTNPTITDENGWYIFKGLDPNKKYVVKFRYNGVIYEPVQAFDNVEIYNKEEWGKTSKATEKKEDREKLNDKFTEISADNKVYLQTNLENEKIYDGYNIYELITNKVRAYINETNTYPNLVDNIYKNIIEEYSSVDSDIENKLKFIEDCKIDAWTNKYPIYDKFIIGSEASKSYTIDSYFIPDFYNVYGDSDDTYKDDIGEKMKKLYKKLYDEMNNVVVEYSGKYDSSWYQVINLYDVEIDRDNKKIIINKIPNVLELLKQHIVDTLNDKLNVPKGTEEYERNKANVEAKFGAYKESLDRIIDEIIIEVSEFYKGVEFSEIEGVTYTDTAKPIYPGQKQIHLGLVKREEFDLSLAKDVYQVELSINGKNITYNYNDVKLTSAEDWIAEVNTNDGYYERSIYAADYNYYLEDNPNKLEIYVTYRIALRNQTKGIVGKVIEIVDYYDEDYTYIENSAYVGDGTSKKIGNCELEDTSIYAEGKKNKETDQLNAGFIRFDGDGLQIDNSMDKFIYIKFKVDDSEGQIIADGQIDASGIRELEKSKQNIVEINGYKTYYEGITTSYNGIDKSAGIAAGVMDWDSIPGNYTPSDNYNADNKQYYANEDDVGVANGLYLLIDYYNERTIEGTVWEDKAIEELLKDKIRQGNGSYDEGEKLIQNVKTTLMKSDIGDEYNFNYIAKYYDIELKEWLPIEIYTDENGKYSLTGFVPGDYEVWFTYDNYSINADRDGTNYNETRYNGQDFKSTIYQDKTDGDKWYLDENNHKSDAKDIWTRREKVIDYSKVLTNDIAEQLVPSNLGKYNTEATTMYAKTDVMKIDVEYDKPIDETDPEEPKHISESISKLTEAVVKDDYSKYVIDNVDFGLVERPRAQLSIQKNVANAKVVLADGTVLFDAIPDENGKFIAENVGSIPRRLAEAYVETIEESDIITKLKNSSHVSTEQGRITMNMDEELMQGANLQVTYEISVENIGEIDYNNQEFYYNGARVTRDDTTITINIPNVSNLVKTKVDQIIDYVENNMKFNKKLNNVDINQGWEVKTKDDIGTNNSSEVVLKDTVIQALFNSTENITDDGYNTIAVLTGEAIAKHGSEYAIDDGLKIGETAKSDFILTQLISPDNENDDLTYKNVLEIVKTTNDVGRRMYFSIAGNHVPVERDRKKVLGTSLRPEGREIDTDDGELITIIPPFGANMQEKPQLAILGIVLVTFFGIGVYLINKKVLK